MKLHCVSPSTSAKAIITSGGEKMPCGTGVVVNPFSVKYHNEHFKLCESTTMSVSDSSLLYFVCFCVCFFDPLFVCTF